MTNSYLYDDVPVLKNKLGIKDKNTLDLIEAEQSRANMMLLYEQGFHNFASEGLQSIHHSLFGDIYDWAGKFRIINIEKREKLLAGLSVLYSDNEKIPDDLNSIFEELHNSEWNKLSKSDFVSKIVRIISKIWRVHPFREGNTRAVVMMLAFFIEDCGYYMNQNLIAKRANRVRNSFVMASLDRYSEYEHLERILMDTICCDPIQYDLPPVMSEPLESSTKYVEHQSEDYMATPHYRSE